MSTSKSASDRVIELSPGDKKLLRFERIVVETEARDSDLKAIGEEILSEPVVHAWKHLVSSTGKLSRDAIFKLENERRQTQVFFYFGERALGSRELLGIACIASKIRVESSLEGFPVIAQSYIRKAYRNFRVYSPLLSHRMQTCQKAKPKGILMCSQNPRIFNSVMAGSFGFPFKYLGEEDLPRRGGLSRLRHFIWVSAEFEHTLKNFHDAAAQLGTGFIELSQMVTALLENRFSNASYGQIKLLLVKLESYPNWKKLELGGFIELLAVMDAIPILEDPKAEEKVTVGKTGNEQVA